MFEKVAIIIILLVTSITFTPEILLLNHKIRALENRNRQLSQKRKQQYQSDNPIVQSLPNFASNQIKFIHRCAFHGQKYQAMLFQTVLQIYIAINHPQDNSVHIYNSNCQEISIIKAIQIERLLCDRGICQNGLIHFIGKDHHLYSSNQQQSFKNVLNLASIQPESKIVGGLLRHRGKDKIQIYISFQNGIIKVFDEEGTNKIRLDLQGFNNKIMIMADHHPFPILVTQQNWISMLDTTKYVQMSQNCPHIPNIKYILSENHYGDSIYVITSSKIYVVDFQLGKKLCTVKRQYILQQEINHVEKASYFSNTIFIDEKVYNLTSRKLFKNSEECLSQTDFQFIYKKNQPEQIYSLKNCCNGTQCSVQFFEIKKINEDRSILFWLTVSFIVILFISISFMKKSNVNPFDFDDPIKVKQQDIQQQIMEMARSSKQKPAKTKRK